ncbi:hypothetical protein RI367_000131 [Sorochytrium milnesiophthora]
MSSKHQKHQQHQKGISTAEVDKLEDAERQFRQENEDKIKSHANREAQAVLEGAGISEGQTNAVSRDKDSLKVGNVELRHVEQSE